MHRSFQSYCVVSCLVVVAGCDPCLNNPCDDGVFCNGVETCAAGGNQVVCSDGTFVNCGLGFVCMETSEACVSEGIADPCATNPCDDGVACNGAETCTPEGSQAICSDGTPIACPVGEVCFELNGDCRPIEDRCVGNPCDDGFACNGLEVCTAEGNQIFCSDGTPIICQLNEVCTEPDGDCTPIVDPCAGNPCNDGLSCNGFETCTDVANHSVCSDGTPILCDLNEVCTEPNGTCVPGCSPVTRTVAINPPSGTLVYGVEDTPPAGWTITDISHDGEYDASNNAVKWFFLDDDPRTLSYTATPPAGTMGSHCFDGVVNYDGGANVATPQECLDPCI